MEKYLIGLAVFGGFILFITLIGAFFEEKSREKESSEHTEVEK